LLQAFSRRIRYTFRERTGSMVPDTQHKQNGRHAGILGALKQWVWSAREDPASAFRAGVFITFGFLAVLSCLFAIAFAITTTLIQSGARSNDPTAAQTTGRRAEMQRLLASPKLGIEERAILSNVLACIDAAAATSNPTGETPQSAAGASRDDSIRRYETACAGKLVSDVAIAHGGERGQRIVWELQRLGVELPPEYR
jgi:hypothetical protein